MQYNDSVTASLDDVDDSQSAFRSDAPVGCTLRRITDSVSAMNFEWRTSTEYIYIRSRSAVSSKGRSEEEEEEEKEEEGIEGHRAKRPRTSESGLANSQRSVEDTRPPTPTGTPQQADDITGEAMPDAVSGAKNPCFLLLATCTSLRNRSDVRLQTQPQPA